MVQSSQSDPGQFASALRKAAIASREGAYVPPELLGLKHGHEGEPDAPEPTIDPPRIPAPSLWPGTETADG